MRLSIQHMLPLIIAALWLTAVPKHSAAEALVAPNTSLAAEELLQTLPEAEQKRTHQLWNHVRCVVCDGQSIAQSNAAVAQDLRLSIAQKVAAGEANDAIFTYLTQRYGDAVLMKPPVNVASILLWAAPLLFLIIGLAIAYRPRRPRSS